MELLSIKSLSKVTTDENHDVKRFEIFFTSLSNG